MPEERDRKPTLSPSGQEAAAARQRRLAAALRENLRKRKAQERARQGNSGSPAGPVDKDPDRSGG